MAYPGFQRGGCLMSGPIQKVGGGGGGGESFLHSCRGHSEIDKMFSHVPHARVALEEIMQ